MRKQQGIQIKTTIMYSVERIEMLEFSIQSTLEEKLPDIALKPLGWGGGITIKLFFGGRVGFAI